MIKKLTLLISFALLCHLAYSEEKDTLKTTDNRNMLLNAESATVPREINIGLPEGGTGAIVYIDGSKQGQGLPRSQYHWQSGNSYLPAGSISLMDAVISTGEIGVLVDSYTKLGTDQLHGDFTFATSSFGQIRFDGVVNGPISKKKGLFFSFGAFVNYDPTSVNAPTRTFVDQKQIYNLALTKRWGSSELSFIYRFSYCNDNVDGTYNKSPFIYNGDGSISQYKDFRIGKDCYFPADDKISYMDVATGQMKQSSLSKIDHRLLHDISITGRHVQNGWNMYGVAHLCIMQPSQFIKVSISGIDQTTSGYNFADGKAFTGNLQNRFVIIDDLYTYDFEARFLADKKYEKHHVKLGISGIYTYQYEAGSSAYFAHEADANPSRIYKGDLNAWNLNKSAQYFRGSRYGIAIHAIDDWNITDRFLARTGARIRPTGLDILSAARTAEDEGTEYNKRVEGFNIADPTKCRLHEIKKFGLDYSVSEHLSYRIVDRLFVMAEGFYSITNKVSTYYKNATIPTTKPIGNALGSGGFMYDNKWVEATALVTYITSWNNAKVMSVSKQIQGRSETIPWTAQYGIGTLSCTLDAVFKYEGFKLHTLFTWQDPRYKNYRNEFKFSDGSVTVVDYTGNYVTGISQIMAELDPSYSWKKYRVWASFRYYSKQYASRTNYAYFNGHFESFAGVDVKFANASKLSLNFTNILFQNGVKGTLDIADTIDDPSLLKNYLMAGSYIRPFEVLLSYTYHF